MNLNDLLDGFFNLLTNFGEFIFNIMISLINAFVLIFLKPIILGLNLLFTTFIGDYQSMITSLLSNIDRVINNIIIPYGVWVINLFPPATYGVIILFLGLYLAVWTYDIYVGITLKLLKLIKKTIPIA